MIIGSNLVSQGTYFGKYVFLGKNYFNLDIKIFTSQKV